MRVILVGTRAERARLRAELDPLHTEVVAEFDTLAQVRASDVPADAVVIPVRRRPTDRQADQELENGTFEEPLTPRELEVLELLAEGLPNKSIAARLAISDQTVKFHVAAITGKLGARNRTDAVRRALRRGLVTI